jgi:hypothetical protein
VSFDGFQSAQLLQDLQNAGFTTEYVSCDKSTDPYQALRGAIMENRLSIYEYGPVEEELSLLQLDPITMKVDHLPGGKKDCADALAGVAWHCTEQVRMKGNADYNEAATKIRNPAGNRKGNNDVNLFEHPDLDWMIDSHNLL